MNLLQHIYPGDVMASFVIRVLAEITLVTVLAFLLARVLARKNPAMRHGICVCALLCVALAPLTTLGLEQLGWSTFSIRLEAEKQAVTTVAIPYGEKVVAVVQPESHAFWTLERARDTASLIILIWALGTGVLLYRLLNGSRKVRALRKSAREIDDPKLRAALASISFPTRAPVRFSKRLYSPVVVGPRQTTVILPEKLLGQLDADQLRCVLAHELTHVRQRDPLIGLIQRLVEAGYWPHPMVHVLNRDLVRAREEVCDNAALNGTTAPQYADTLLTVALGMSPQHASLGIGLMAKRWRLEERVKGLLDPQRRLTTTMNTRHLAFVLVALAAGTAMIAGAHVVAAPNPPSFQQALDLYSHYNPKTKKVTITSKLTQEKPAKKSKVTTAAAKHGSAPYVTYQAGKNWTVLPQGTLVRVRYAPSDANALKGVGASNRLEFSYADGTAVRAKQKGTIQFKDAKGKTQTIQFENVKVDPTSKGGPVVDVVGAVDASKDLTVVAGKAGDATAYTVQSSDGNPTTYTVQSGDRNAKTYTVQSGDGGSKTFTVKSSDVRANTPDQVFKVDALVKSASSSDASVNVTVNSGDKTAKDKALSDTTIVEKLVQSDQPKVLTLNGRLVYSVSGAGAQSGDTIVITPKDGVVYVNAQESSKTPVTVYTVPQYKASPLLKLYSKGVKQYVYGTPEVKFFSNRLQVKSNGLTLEQVQPKGWTVSPNIQYKTYNLWSKPKSPQTTVYIDGDHIRVVGDNIKVVHVDSAKSKAKKVKNPKSK